MTGRVVAADRRFRSIRRARRRRAWRPAVVMAVVATVVAAVGWAAMASPLLRVTNVTVKGTSRLSVADVITAAKVPLGSSLIAVPVDAIKRRVSALAPVAQVRVERRWPHTVVIAVTERIPVAVAVSAGGDELLDRSGVAFAAVETPPRGLPLVALSQPVPGPGQAAAAAALQVWAGLPAGLRAQVSRVTATSADNVSLELTSSRVVVWGSADQMRAKIAALTALLSQHARVYDVSTPTIAVTRG
jgi:cell division protein FtsQ